MTTEKTAPPPQTLAFTEIDVPTIERPKAPNPFDRVFPTAEGKALTFTLPAKSDAEKANVKATINQARRAAKALGLTARVSVKEDKGIADLTVWTVPKIERRRTSNETTDEKADA